MRKKGSEWYCDPVRPKEREREEKRKRPRGREIREGRQGKGGEEQELQGKPINIKLHQVPE